MVETKKYARVLGATYGPAWYADKVGRVFEVESESCTYLVRTGPHHLSAILKEDAELIVTEKRPAKVGERVLITVAAPIGKQAYETGDIFVAESLYDPFTKDIRVLGMPDFIDYNEYEVIVNNEVKNEEADGMKIDLSAMGYDELIAHGEDVMRAIRLRAYGEGYRQGKFDAEMDSTHGQAPIVSAQARRDEIVEQAKADVERLKENNRRLRTFNISLEVNRKDRSVEAIAKRPKSNRAFYGIAKAAPDDCFNVHIGRAIALRRALGLVVPDEYLNAPQPTEVRVGDVVYGKYSEAYYQLWCEDEIGDVSYEAKIKEIVDGKYRYVGGGYDFIEDADLTIIDDSREEVGE
ncbi:hypothetical protein [Bacillus velezensis]|uniref:hypothetical protein n=1 Tax=Bacillus velezensis TaxID=492670 RepID=UPI00167036FC|nr:hypothetical protein [Bacillus velezensis]